jgi:hypothetical protein
MTCVASYDPTVHLLAGAGAGMLASAFTNPFDVAKTRYLLFFFVIETEMSFVDRIFITLFRLQTQGDVGKLYKGMVDALSTIWREEGCLFFLKKKE